VTRASATAATDRTLQHRRADYAQLLNQLAAVSQLTFISGNGRELLRMSRTQVVTDGDGDFSRDVRFIETNARGVTFAPAYFVGSRPFMSIAVAHSGFNAGVTLAEIDLRFLNDFLGDAQIGKAGYALCGRCARPCWRARRARRSARNSPACRRSRPSEAGRRAAPPGTGADGESGADGIERGAETRLVRVARAADRAGAGADPHQLVRSALLIALGLRSRSSPARCWRGGC
jgi:hypothetical protein